MGMEKEKAKAFDKLLEAARRLDEGSSVHINWCGQSRHGDDLWEITEYKIRREISRIICLQGTKNQIIESLANRKISF